jgi:hypothetical protein
MKCQLPIGERFREWIVEEVVPTIRRTGQYKLEESFNAKLTIKDKQHAEQLAIKDEIIAIKDERIASKDEQIDHLQEKAAVMTIRNETKHIFQLYKHRFKNTYIFVRTQSMYLPAALRTVDLENFDLLINEINVPNAMNILNILKEKLREQKIYYMLSHNKLTVDANVVEMIGDLIEEART